MVAKRRQTPDQYMTVDEAARFMDEWAAEQNEIAKDNQRADFRIKAEHAERVGINWREPGGLQKALWQLAKDADIGAGQREHGRASPGPRGKYRIMPDVAAKAVQWIHEQYPQLTHAAVCAMVGKYTKQLTPEMKVMLTSLGITGPNYKDGQMVCRLTKKLKWPAPRS